MSERFGWFALTVLVIVGVILWLVHLTGTPTLKPAGPLSKEPAPIRKYDVVAEYPHDPKLLTVSHFLVNYPFANRLFPDSLDVIEHVKQWGQPVILSDGDVVFQPRKVDRSGIFEAVDGNVLIYVHKEKELDDVEQRHPAEHYVLVDDKLRILAAIKKIWAARVTTVFVRQGHYALDPKILTTCPAADVSIERIGDLLEYTCKLCSRQRVNFQAHATGKLNRRRRVRNQADVRQQREVRLEH